MLEQCRWLYNHLLAQRKNEWEQSHTSLSLYDLHATLPPLKKEHPALRQVHSQVLQNVAARVDLAFKAYFRRSEAGQSPGYPRFRGTGRYDSICYPQYGNGAHLSANSSGSTSSTTSTAPAAPAPSTCPRSGPVQCGISTVPLKVRPRRCALGEVVRVSGTSLSPVNGSLRPCPLRLNRWALTSASIHLPPFLPGKRSPIHISSVPNRGLSPKHSATSANSAKRRRVRHIEPGGARL